MFQGKVVTNATRQLASKAVTMWPTLLAKNPFYSKVTKEDKRAKAASRSNVVTTHVKRLGPNVEIQVLRRRLRGGSHSG